MPDPIFSSFDLKTKPLKLPCSTFYLLSLALLCLRGFLSAGHMPLYHPDVSGGLLKEKLSACNAKTNAQCPASAASYV